MRPHEFRNFAIVAHQLQHLIEHRSQLVHTDHWQGANISDKPEMATHEVRHVSFMVALPHESIGGYAADVKPNLPWADNHFEERVCGAPINPGVEWRRWPYGHTAARFLDEQGMFNHNYMERYWPKYARLFLQPSSTKEEWDEMFDEALKRRLRPGHPNPHRGILYEYGDLNNVVSLLAGDPLTRQAYLPVWFPEDTGGGTKRAPCSLGYHFLMRDGQIDVDYHIRSCDFIRHWADDVYLTVRLLLWVLERCREKDERWKDIIPGKFIMHIGSLHMFRNDYNSMFGGSRR